MDFREEELKEKLNKKMFAVIDDKRISESVKIGKVKYLLRLGADIEAKDDEARCAIFYATKNGLKDLAEMLLEKGANRDEVDKNGNGVLIYSCNQEMYDFWIDKGVILEESIGEYPLCVASKNGSLFMVKKLVEKEECVDEKDYNAYTPLMYAVENGHKDIAKYLIEEGANIEARDAGGKTPLIFAVIGRQNEIMDMLLDNGAELEAKDFEGWTALVYGATEGDAKSVDKLIQKGANVNHQTDYGETPIMLVSDDIEMVKKLLECGADVNIKDFEDETVLSRVVSSLVYDEKIVELLVQNGADVNVRDKVGRTPLMKVIKNDDYKFEVVKMLVENGAKIAVEDKWGSGPIVLAIGNRRSDAEEYLKEKQGDNPKVEVFYSFSQNVR